MSSKHRRRGVLALADGRCFRGTAFGAERVVDDAIVGEVVFNTSLFGYQEILTDPSYAGQIMTFTTPHIGNVGCNQLDIESNDVHVEGLIIRNLSRRVSNFRANQTLSEYLISVNKMGLADVNTRELVKHIRDQGAQMGAFACIEEDSEIEMLVKKAKDAGTMEGKDYVRHVSCKEPYVRNELPWSLDTNTYGVLSQDKVWSRPHVIALDCGIKFNIIRMLLEAGFRVTVVPASHTAEQILALKPDALFISNGPGDPATLGYCIKTVEKLLGSFPIFGICLGHQVLAQVLGAKTYKMKFGHRGANHPVKNLKTGKVEITVQNHGFAVDRVSLPKTVKLTHVNLNDDTVEGLEVPEHMAFSIQYHPEASSGPHDARYLFRQFFENVVGYRNFNRLESDFEDLPKIANL